jgi:hypothetical protein
VGRSTKTERTAARDENIVRLVVKDLLAQSSCLCLSSSNFRTSDGFLTAAVG